MKKKQIIIIASIVAIIVVAIVVLAIVGGGATSEKKQFAKYVSQMLETNQIIDENILEKYVDKKESTPYKSSGVISSKTDEQEVSIEYESKTAKTENAKQTNISIKKDNEEILPFEYLQNDDIYGVKFNSIAGQTYVAVRNDKLKDLAKKFGITDTDIIPDKLEFDEYKNLFTISELNQIIQKYQDIVTNYLSNKEFTKIKEDDLNGYRLLLSDNDLKNILTEILNTLKTDTTIKNKIEVVYSNSDENIYDTFVKEIDDAINSLNSIESINKDDLISITVYEKNKTANKIVLIIDDGDKTKVNINITKTEGKINFNLMSDDQNIGDLYIEENNNADQINTTIGINTANNSTVEISINYSGLQTLDKISESVKINTKNGNLTNKISYDAKVEFLDTIDIEEFKDDNHVVLNDKDAEYVQRLTSVLSQKILEELQNNLDLTSLTTFDGISSLNSSSLSGLEDSSQLEAQEIASFNAILSAYEGQANSSKVELLINTISRLSTTDNNQIQCEYLEELYDAEDVEDIDVDSDKTYNISFDYDAKGRINKVIIEAL